MSQTCILCTSSIDDEVQFGELITKNNVTVHYLTSTLVQEGNDDEGIYGFRFKRITREADDLRQFKCAYCHKRGANIACCHVKCRRHFHTVCGAKNNVQFKFCKTFQSFCDYHVRKIKHRPEPNAICYICYDNLLGEKESFNGMKVLRAPCCQSGWFHKLCLQKYAMTAGYFFKCPLCNDVDKFHAEIAELGVFILKQDAAWELEPNAFNDLLYRPNVCNLCGVEEDFAEIEDNPFVYCNTCGGAATHRNCLNESINVFNCVECLEALQNLGQREDVQQNNANDSCDVMVDVENCDDNVPELVNIEIFKPSNSPDSGNDTGENITITNKQNDEQDPSYTEESDDEEDETSVNRDSSSPESPSIFQLIDDMDTEDDLECINRVLAQRRRECIAHKRRISKILESDSSEEEEEEEEIIIRRRKRNKTFVIGSDDSDNTQSSRGRTRSMIKPEQNSDMKAVGIGSDDSDNNQSSRRSTRILIKAEQNPDTKAFIGSDDSDNTQSSRGRTRMKAVGIGSDDSDNIQSSRRRTRNKACVMGSDDSDNPQSSRGRTPSLIKAEQNPDTKAFIGSDDSDNTQNSRGRTRNKACVMGSDDSDNIQSSRRRTRNKACVMGSDDSDNTQSSRGRTRSLTKAETNPDMNISLIAFRTRSRRRTLQSKETQNNSTEGNCIALRTRKRMKSTSSQSNDSISYKKCKTSLSKAYDVDS